MLRVLGNTWALMLGLFLLMLGNGLQGTLLGVRGDIEGFGPGTMSFVMSAYFIGFLGGSRLAPHMIRRVGHVRVFAALGSIISAAFILFPAFPDPVAWFVLRLFVGFCYSAVYVVVESWLNNASDNSNRGQALSLYLIIQMMGIITAQGILLLQDPAGWILFVVISVAVSLSFLPILLDVSPAPIFDTTKPMSLRALYGVSPLGVVSVFFLGGIFAAMFGMASVYGTEKGLSLAQISLFISAMYVGGLVLQYPIGWLSDRMDRRRLIVICTALGTVVTAVGSFLTEYPYILLFTSFMIGGLANPLYSLLIAYTNDFLEHEDMAAASGGLIFINGLGAISGPFVVGFMMSNLGPDSYFLFICALMGIITLYGLYRMTQRSATSVEDAIAYSTLSPTSSPVILEWAQEYAIDQANEDDEIKPDAEENR